jgi:hypothetical protein
LSQARADRVCLSAHRRGAKRLGGRIVTVEFELAQQGLRARRNLI